MNRRLLNARKRKYEFSPYALGADHVNVFIVGLDHFFYNGQAKACPFCLFPRDRSDL